MEAEDMLQLFILSTVVLTLFSASLSDYRSREVSDYHWLILGSVGILGHAVISLINGCNVIWVIPCAAIALLYQLTILFGSNRCIVAVMIVSMAVGGFTLCTISGNEPLELALPLLLTQVFLAFYYLGIIRGGADVKCLIALVFAIPLDPGMSLMGASHIPSVLRLAFGPAISVLFMASVLSVLGCIMYCLWRNRHEVEHRFNRLCGYMIPLDEVPRSFAWPAERIEEGVRIRSSASDNPEELCREYADQGIERIYVTPMVPFIIPITVAVIVVLFIGNPLFIF